MRDMIGSAASILELQRHAESRSTSSLLQDAHAKVVQGLTTPEEVLRVLGPQGEE
jgi:type II secretory ATPase GspE/PulE/Tfp pilus assembly ATPase PilB-like protein